MLQRGDPAPAFDLPDADMNPVCLEHFRTRHHVVLYFYPHDDTPGCTLEAIEFSDLADQFEKLKAVIIGVSMDDCISHGTFRDKHGLSVQLLSDVDGEVCRRYGVVQEKEVEGKRRVGIQRSTFVIDAKGVIRHVCYGAAPRGHAHEILDVVRRIAKCR